MNDSRERTPKSFISLRSVDRKEHLLVFMLLLALAACFHLELFSRFSTHVLGGAQRDAGLYVWLSQSAVKEFFHIPWFETNAFYPYGLTRAWSDCFLLPAFLIAVLMSIGIGFVAAYNSILFLAIVLNGYCTYRLCRLLSSERKGPLLAAIAFMCVPFLTEHLGHPQLQFAFFIPIGLELLFRFLRAPSLLVSFFLGMTISLAFLCSFYYALFLCLALFMLVLALLFFVPYADLATRRIAILVTGGIAGLLPLLPFVVPYLAVRRTFGSRGVFESYYFAADGLSYLSSPILSFLYPFTASLTHSEAHLYPGSIPLLAFLFCFWRLKKHQAVRSRAALVLIFLLGALVTSSCAGGNRHLLYLCSTFIWSALICFPFVLIETAHAERQDSEAVITQRGVVGVFIFLAVFFFAFSLGPLGNPEKGHVASGVFRVFYEFFPGVNSVRAVSRAGIVTVFFLCALIPFGIGRYLDSSTYGRIFASIAAAVILVESYQRSFALEAYPAIPSVVHRLREERVPDDVVAFLPMTDEITPSGQVARWGDFAEKNVQAMMYALHSETRTINGYSGQRTKIMREFPRKLSGFPDERSISALSTIANLRFLVFNSTHIENFDRQSFLSRCASFQNDIRFIMADEDGNYLFEFIHFTPIQEPYFLRIPARPTGYLSVEFMALPRESAPSVAVDLLEVQAEQTLALGKAEFPADGHWHEFSVKIQRAQNPVRPRTVRFVSEQQDHVLIRRRRFQIDQLHTAPDEPGQD